MKEMTFFLDNRLIEIANRPIRTKKDTLLLLMYSIKHMLIYHYMEIKDTSNKMVLKISKMSRLLFVTQNKAFSICFPFSIKNLTNEGISIRSTEGTDIDSKITSEIIELLLKQELIEFRNIDVLYEVFLDIDNPTENLWTVFMNLLMHEDGYIRCDYDPERYVPGLHPENHFDIFYGDSNTFKLGLNKRLNAEEILNILDLTLPCYSIQ